MRPQPLRPLLMLLARATQPEVIRQLQYLKVENRILRSKLPRRIPITPAERARLVRFGKRVGPALRHLITIVTPQAFGMWVKGRPLGKAPAGPGRPRKPREVRELIWRIARETGWGYVRILGEFRKVSSCRMSVGTVKNILKERGAEPGPDRGEDGWDEFIKRHASTLWACDFFSKRVWTWSGLQEYFVLFFIHLGSRRVHLGGVTAHPDAAWMAQQARNFSMHLGDHPEIPRARFLLRDGDRKFPELFDAILKVDGIEVKTITPYAPKQNAYAEAWVGAAKRECLNHFMVFGEDHLRYLVREYIDYYNAVRPHRSLGNVPIGLEGGGWRPGEPRGKVVCQERLGGLLRHYYRRAA